MAKQDEKHLVERAYITTDKLIKDHKQSERKENSKAGGATNNKFKGEGGIQFKYGYKKGRNGTVSGGGKRSEKKKNKQKEKGSVKKEVKSPGELFGCKAQNTAAVLKKKGTKMYELLGGKAPSILRMMGESRGK